MSKNQEAINAILAPLKEGAAGVYLRYDPIYDQIREARTEDDHRLSRGVWQMELKKSDHATVENLCINALTEKTKDLQIAAWLADSWTLLHGLEGLFDGTQLIHQFIKTYYDTMYPLDEEHRLRLFEWIDNEFRMRLYTLPLTQFNEAIRSYNYHDIVSAKTFDAALRREPETSAKQIERAHKRGDALLPHVNTAIAQTPPHVMQEYTAFLRKIEDEFKAIRTFLDEKLGKDSPGFTQIFTTLTDIMRITKVDADDVQENPTPEVGDQAPSPSIETTQSQNVPVSIPVKASEIGTTRKDAYQSLRNLADIFSKIEPHSPTANVLRKVSEWEDKQLVDILGGFSKSPDALSMFMGFIATENKE